MSDNYVFFDDLRAHAPLPEDGILSRTLHGDERTKVIQFCFAKGQELSAHTAPCPALLYFAQGEEARSSAGTSAEERRARPFPSRA